MRIRVTQTSYRDCCTSTANGHEFLVANAWTRLGKPYAVSVRQTRLSRFPGELAWIEPARYGSIVAARPAR